MTKKVAGLLMMATLIFAEMILKEGGDLDRIADAAPGIAAPTRTNEFLSVKNDDDAETGSRHNKARATQGAIELDPWEAPAEPRPAIRENYASAEIRQSSTPQADIQSSSYMANGALSSDQMNLEY